MLVFLYLTINIYLNKPLLVDNFFYTLLVLKLRNVHLTKIMIGFTYLGSVYSYVTLLILFLIFIKNKKIPLLAIANILTSVLLMKIIKNIIKRPRPDGYRLIPEKGYSFPSGHALNAVVFYGILIYIIHTNIKNKKTRIILKILLTTLVLLIGLSRIYLGVHYASDVLAGFLFGFICVYLFIELVYKKVMKIK